jgi:hypothetical protein
VGTCFDVPWILVEQVLFSLAAKGPSPRRCSGRERRLRRQGLLELLSKKTASLAFSSGCSFEGTIMVDICMYLDVVEATTSDEKG